MHDKIEAAAMLFHTAFGLLHSSSMGGLKESGLRPPQAFFLGFLRHTGSLNISAVSRLTNVTPSVGTRFVERLEKAGMVERVPDEKDRRIVTVRMTEKGDKVSAAFQDAIDARFRESLEGVDPADVEAFIRVLEAINRNVAKDAPFDGMVDIHKWHREALGEES